MRWGESERDLGGRGAGPYRGCLCDAGTGGFLATRDGTDVQWFYISSGDLVTTIVDDGGGGGLGDDLDPCPFESPDDSDGDGVCDSADACPGFDDRADRDGDGTADSCDDCPDDPGKLAAGVCGCGASDDDADGNGAPDCLDTSAGPGGGCGPSCGLGTPFAIPLLAVGMLALRRRMRRSETRNE